MPIALNTLLTIHRSVFPTIHVRLTNWYESIWPKTTSFLKDQSQEQKQEASKWGSSSMWEFKRRPKGAPLHDHILLDQEMKLESLKEEKEANPQIARPTLDLRGPMPDSTWYQREIFPEKVWWWLTAQIGTDSAVSLKFQLSLFFLARLLLVFKLFQGNLKGFKP